MRTEPALRERKKQQTRQAISSAAFELFSEHGFDAVTVAGVARRANVSEATVFNYFPTKEDLIYSRLEAFEAAMIEAIRERPSGQSITTAFGEFVLGSGGLLGTADPELRNKIAAIARIIADSPALLARERLIYDRYTRTLAGLIAEQRSLKPGDVEAWVVANAIIGVHRSLVEFARSNLLAGRAGPGLLRRVRAQAQRALDIITRGLGEYPDMPTER